MDKDTASTLAGGGAGMALLFNVRWEAVPHGEVVRIAVALVLIALGCAMYRKV